MVLVSKVVILYFVCYLVFFFRPNFSIQIKKTGVVPCFSFNYNFKKGILVYFCLAPLSHYFVEISFTLVTASNLSGFVSTSFAHLFLRNHFCKIVRQTGCRASVNSYFHSLATDSQRDLSLGWDILIHE